MLLYISGHASCERVSMYRPWIKRAIAPLYGRAAWKAKSVGNFWVVLFYLHRKCNKSVTSSAFKEKKSPGDEETHLGNLVLSYLLYVAMWRGSSVTVRREGKAMDRVKLCGSLKWMLDPPSMTQDTTFGKALFCFGFFFPPLRYSSASLTEKWKDLPH